MKQEDRRKVQEFIKAELGQGGTLSTRGYRTLITLDKVSVDMSPFRQAVNELVESGQVIKRACHDDYVLAPMTGFDSKNRGKRKFVYTYSRAGQRYVSKTGGYRAEAPQVTTLLHLVTPWGTFGNCTVGKTFATFDEAKNELLNEIGEAQIENTDRWTKGDAKLCKERDQAQAINRAKGEQRE